MLPVSPMKTHALGIFIGRNPKQEMEMQVERIKNEEFS